MVVCGLGPGGQGDVTDATREVLSEAGVPRFLRTTRHPTVHLAGEATSFDSIYDAADDLGSVYGAIAERLALEADLHGRVVYAVPGSPLVLERSVQHLRENPLVSVELLPAISFLDSAWARLGIDPVEERVRLIDGHTFARQAAGETGPLLVAHAHAPWVLSDIKLAVDAGPEMKAVVLQRLGTDQESIREVPWPDLDRDVEPDHLTSLYLPAVTAPVAQELQKAVELMHRLRQDCPWDREQTHESLRRYLIEETYEVVEAVDALSADDASTGDAYIDLEEELGDVLFQILFHAELASEAGAFNIADVARTVHDKLVSRHPHVFSETEAADAAAVVANWEAIKKVEKGRDSIMDGIPAGLPALSRAEKVLKKGSRAGRAPAQAEMVALVNAELSTTRAHEYNHEGFGVGMLALVELARRVGIDPEAALRDATVRAENRFREHEDERQPTAWVGG